MDVSKAKPEKQHVLRATYATKCDVSAISDRLASLARIVSC